MAVALHPRVVILDLLSGVDGGSGFGLIKDLCVQCTGTDTDKSNDNKDTRTLVCSGALAAPTIGHLFAIGASGYLGKDEPADHAAAAVRAVAAGRIYVAPDAAGAVIADLGRPRRANGRSPKSRPARRADAAGDEVIGDVSRGAALLSGGELEIVHMIGNGLETRPIAAILHKSIKTIQTYRSRIGGKLRLHGAQALAQWAWQFVHAARTKAA